VILVDTSVLVDLLRGRHTPASDRLRQLEATGTPYGIPMICCQEVLQGAKDEREWRTLRAYLGTQRLVLPQDPQAVHLEAARIFFDCRRRGVTVRSTVDCLIAALVLEGKNALLHDDADFEQMRKVRPLATLRG
jgi:predicted nucleic acid-binding protein